MPGWFKLTARVREKEAFLLWLAESGTRGVWEVDDRTLVAYALSPFPPPPESLVESFTQEEEAGEDWERKWREKFTTVWAVEDVTVRPPWERTRGVPFDLVIYPAFAFGTGHHPTTVLCLRMIRKYLKKGMAFLDVGTGSGVLAFLAWKMRARPIVAVDCDPLACAEFERNAALNGIPGEDITLVGDLALVRGTFDCVVVNISASFCHRHFEDLLRRLREGGYLILSGFTEKDLIPLLGRARRQHLQDVEIAEDSSWMVVVLHRFPVV
jgi:ribosomal protein L11 methyltransferase